MGKRKSEKSENEAKPRKKRRCVRKLLVLAVLGGVAALAVSEPLRNKALDAVFGSEEQFQYTPPASTPPDGADEA